MYVYSVFSSVLASYSRDQIASKSAYTIAIMSTSSVTSSRQLFVDGGALSLIESLHEKAVERTKPKERDPNEYDMTPAFETMVRNLSQVLVVLKGGDSFEEEF